MKKITSTICAMLVAFVTVFGFSRDASALPCILCFHYRTVPPGFFDCTYDRTAYPGETLYFDETNFNGWCIGHGNAPAQFNSLGQWDNAIKSVKNNTSYETRLYPHPNQGGTPYVVVPPNSNASNVSVSSGASSIKQFYLGG
jgi:hypothetical protein